MPQRIDDARHLNLPGRTQRLAGVGHFKPGQLGQVLLHEVGDLPQQIGPLPRGQRRPAGESRPGRCHRARDVRFRGCREGT